MVSLSQLCYHTCSMAQPVSLDFKTHTPSPVQEKPCYTELLACIQAIWNAVCKWISWIFSAPEYNLAERNQDCYCLMVRYLEPEDLARCERVAKSWKTDRIWQAQCANYGITVAPASSRWKDLFEVPEMAFGPREWEKHFGKAGPMPPLPVNIKSQVAELGQTHTLTLVPKTVNGQPLSLISFAPLAEKSGMKLKIFDPVLQKYGEEAAEKSLWVWQQKEVESEKRLPQVIAENLFPNKLGRTLWVVVSIVAYYARTKIRLFSRKKEWLYIRTRDWGGEDQSKREKHFYGSKAWSVVVGGSAPDSLIISNFHPLISHHVASTFPAEEFN